MHAKKGQLDIENETDLFALRWQKIDERLDDRLCHRKTLLFPGFMETQIHEKSSWIFEAIRRGCLSWKKVDVL